MSKIKLTLLASGFIFILGFGMQPTSKADEENKIYFPGSETDFLKSDDLSWDKIPQHYVPSKGIGDWQKLYTKRPKQWKEGYSAYELAHSWENAKPDLPPEIAALFYGSVELLAATPEHKTPLPGGRAASQSDVLAFIRINDRVCAVAVEGKVKEEFGTQTVGQWFKNPSPGKIERLKYISTTLGLSYPPPDEIRYQLLHRTASAVIEAQHFKTDCATMIVQSFSPENKWFEDYSAFLDLFGIQSAKQDKLYKTDKPGITLYFGWAPTPTDTVVSTEVAAIANQKAKSSPDASKVASFNMRLVWILLPVGLIIIAFLVSKSRRKKTYVNGKITQKVEYVPEETTSTKTSEIDTITSAFQKQIHKLEKVVDKILSVDSKNRYWKEKNKDWIDFEEYVKGKFNNPPFNLFDNRAKYPDFKLTFSANGKTEEFAVECKWRNGFFSDGTIEICGATDLKKYKNYQKYNQQKVFIVLGVNKPGSDPSSIYIIPVENLTTNMPHVKDLTTYLQSSKGNFSYDPDEEDLIQRLRLRHE